MDKPKPSNDKARSGPTTPTATRATTPPTPPVPPRLFRPIDWLTFLITFLFVFVSYWLTLSPALTLEDSGELATGAFYAGIPHPPGYPVWTVYSWVWTVLVPFKNIAWRVALGCAFSGALASGLLAFVASRGSSMILESIDDLKNLDRRWESAICLVSGFVAGTLLGFNGYMWSQSVIVEVYPLSVVSLLGVILCLLRWVYAPHQHRYLYWAFFLYGICFNNHQSLLVIAIGMEVLIAVVEPKLGREMLFWNTLIYLLGLIISPTILTGNGPVLVIFNVVGIASAILWLWLFFKTGKTGIEFGRDLSMLAVLGFAGLFLLGFTDYIPGANDPVKLSMIFIAGIGAGVLFAWLLRQTRKHGREWLVALAAGGSWLGGAAFYLYMPLAGMSDPPMQWAYPRTVEGFIHAITRGQYDRIRPTHGVGDTAFEVVRSFFETYFSQLGRFLQGLLDEFNPFYLLLALVVFLFFWKMKRRERAWIIGMIAVFVCLGPFLVLLLNFTSDRASLELNRVFLTSSHAFVALSAGYGLALLAAILLTHYASFRNTAILGGVCALDFAVFILAVACQPDFNPDTATIYGYGKIIAWMAAIGCVVFLWHKRLEHDRLLAFGIPGVFLLASATLTVLTVLGDPPRLAGIGVAFQTLVHSFHPDQYGLPVHAALVLLGAAVVFLAAMLFSRNRAPLALTLVIFAGLPSYSIMTHWFENEQREHWFGWWFGHDMFTPPFTAPDGKLSYDAKLRAETMAGPNGALVYPEMTRDAILFGGTDPGRFCPTYMIFCDSFLPRDCQPEYDKDFNRRDVYIITQNALADGTYLQYIRAHYFRSAQKDPPFFQELLRGPDERLDNYQTNILARIAGTVLDKPFLALGARIEKRRRAQGVYPKEEIYTPSNEDSQICFSNYIADATTRLMHDRQYPNEPKQIRPGEGVHFDGQKVQVSGQIAVMAINGLLTKVIFDNNPTNEFFVEESFPLDWMFPHLTPFGIIMKINREPLLELNDDVVRRDHEFWAKYSERFIGNWITYDTPISNITAFVDQVYRRHNYAGFKGDLKFMRDDQAQKAFSKLRSSIAGVYAWRLGMTSGAQTPGEYIARPGTKYYERMKNEAEFAFKQAFAFCPYSPEAVFRYVNFLANLGRADEALLVAETCLRLDPFNSGVSGLVQQLRSFKNGPAVMNQLLSQIAQLDKEWRNNTNDFAKGMDLASKYIQIGQTERGYQVLDSIVANPAAPAGAIASIVGAYIQTKDNVPRLEAALSRYVKHAPEQAEAWYNLAAVRAVLGRNNQAIEALRRAVDLNAKQLAQNPGGRNFRTDAQMDPAFNGLRTNDEFRQLIAPR